MQIKEPKTICKQVCPNCNYTTKFLAIGRVIKRKECPICNTLMIIDFPKFLDNNK